MKKTPNHQRKIDAETQLIIKTSINPYDIAIYTDGSLRHEGTVWMRTHRRARRTDYTRRQWFLPGHQGTSSLTTQVHVQIVTCRTVVTLSTSSDANITYAILPACSVKLSPTIQCGMGCPCCNAATKCCRFSPSLMPCLCPKTSCSLFCRSQRVNRLVSITSITTGLQQLDSAKELIGMGKFAITDRPDHHSTDRPKKDELSRESADVSWSLS